MQLGIMFIVRVREGEGSRAFFVDLNEFFILAIAVVVFGGALEVFRMRLSLDLVGSSKDKKSDSEKIEDHPDRLSSEKAKFQKEKWQ